MSAKSYTCMCQKMFHISELGLVPSPDILINKRLGYWISVHGNKESPLDMSPRGARRVDGSPCTQATLSPLLHGLQVGEAPSDWPKNLTPLPTTWTIVGPTSNINIPLFLHVRSPSQANHRSAVLKIEALIWVSFWRALKFQPLSWRVGSNPRR